MFLIVYENESSVKIGEGNASTLMDLIVPFLKKNLSI
jgi:hypothetical protein